MNKRTPVLSCVLNDLGNIDKVKKQFNLNYLPVGVANEDETRNLLSNLREWWQGRAIPATRKGIEDVLFGLGLENTLQLQVKSLGLSLSDQYWLNPSGMLKWDDVNFFHNDFSEDIGDLLFGGSNKPEWEMSFFTPDNSSEGMLTKRWKIIDGNRYLLKLGSEPFFAEPFNEEIASKIIKCLGINSFVPYEVVNTHSKPLVKCVDFIDENTELVTAYQVMKAYSKPNHVSRYQHLLDCCDKLGIGGMQEHLDKMLTVDYLINNSDRHLRNFGAVRNVETLEWEGVAPIYDNGCSLWYNTSIIDIGKDNIDKSKPFRTHHSKQIELVTSFEGIELDGLKDMSSKIFEIYDKNIYIDVGRKNAIVDSFHDRLSALEEYVQQFERNSTCKDSFENKLERAENRVEKEKKDTATKDRGLER